MRKAYNIVFTGRFRLHPWARWERDLATNIRSPYPFPSRKAAAKVARSCFHRYAFEMCRGYFYPLSYKLVPIEVEENDYNLQHYREMRPCYGLFAGPLFTSLIERKHLVKDPDKIATYKRECY